MTVLSKDPDAIVDYGFNWTPWLKGDTLTSSTWTVDAASGVVIDSNSFDAAGETTVWLSGGTAGQRATVTNHIVTAGERSDDRSLSIQIREK